MTYLNKYCRITTFFGDEIDINSCFCNDPQLFLLLGGNKVACNDPEFTELDIHIEF